MSEPLRVLRLERVRAVCFDAYGTLVPPLSDDPYRDLLVGLPKDAALRFRHRWLTSPVDWDEACADVGVEGERKDGLTFRLRAACAGVALTTTALRAIAVCRRLGWKVALGSNLARPYATAALRSAIADFDAAAWSFECGVVKPAPAFFHILSRQLDVPAEHCLMVGDSLSSDARGAEACGWQALWLGRHDPESALRAWCASLETRTA